MASFATPSNLASYLQVNSVDTVTAQMMLDAASNAIRIEVNQTIDYTTNDVQSYDGPDLTKMQSGFWGGFGPTAAMAGWRDVRECKILLREGPVDLTQPVTIVDGGVSLVQGTDYVVGREGVVYRLNNFFTPGPDTVQVTYSHGWQPTTRQWLAAYNVCLQVAARAYVNPQQAGMVKMGAFEIQYPHPVRSGGANQTFGYAGRVELSDFEKRTLDCLRREQF